MEGCCGAARRAILTIAFSIDYVGLGTRTVPVRCLAVYDEERLDALAMAALLRDAPADVRALYVVAQAGCATPGPNPAFRYREPPFRRHFVDLRIGFDAYLDRMSAARRRSFRRVQRGFAALGEGPLEWREFASVAEAEAFMVLAQDISARTMRKGRYRNAILAAEGAGFQRDAAEGKFRAYVLFHRGTPVAYHQCQVLADVVVSTKAGYAQEYAKHAPGNVLLCVMLEHLFRSRHFARFDFGRGAFDYKESFAKEGMDCVDTFHFRPGAANALLLIEAIAANSLSGVARRTFRVVRSRLAMLRRSASPAAADRGPSPATHPAGHASVPATPMHRTPLPIKVARQAGETSGSE